MLVLSLGAPLRAGAAKDGFRFLERPVGARQMAFGGAATAFSDDLNAALSNPAVWGGLRQPEMSVGFSRFLDAMSAASLAYGHPLSGGGIGFSALTETSGEIQGYDAGDAKSAGFEAKDTLLAVGYGRAFGGDWGGGINVKRVGSSVGDYAARTTAVDAGVSYRPAWAPASWPLHVGAAYRNAGSDAVFVAGPAPLPASVDVGVSVAGLSGALRVGVESHRPRSGGARTRAGAELWLHGALALRVGMETGRALGPGLTLGAGFRAAAIQVDYAYAANGEALGPSHRASLGIRFGGPAERLYQEGVRMAQKGEYAEAILKFEQVLDADPRHVGAVRALRDATDRLDVQMGEELNRTRGK